MLQEVKPPRMSSSRKNLFIVRSAPLLQIQGSAVGPLFEVKINEVLHCGTSLGIFSIVQNRANGRDTAALKSKYFIRQKTAANV